jgi:bifunctional UDP-N-acetylglucosamine pyrophosphorylase/glucosamine-1-phosphate N-acetyltransferase
MSSRSLSAVVLAAGEGTRMRSTRPKPLHLLCGKPMVLHVIDALAELHVDRVVVVVGHGAERVIKIVQEQVRQDLELEFVEQRVQRGTGDAVAVALTAFPEDDTDDSDIVVMPGDTPLVRPATLAALVRTHRAADAAATLLTAEVADPAGYGRVLRGKDDKVRRVVEELDLNGEEFDEFTEVNTSIYCFRRSVLAPSLRRISPDNAKGEYYLTDIVEVLYDAGYPVIALPATDPMEAAGVNDRAQLAIAEAELRDRTNERWMRRGVTMLDPERTYIDDSVELGTDVTIFPGTLLQGATTIGDHAEIGPDARLVDCAVGEGAVIEQTVARQATIGDRARIGPFAVLEAGARVAEDAVVAPFEKVSGADS